MVVDGAEKVLRLKEGLRLAGEARFAAADALAANIKFTAYLLPGTSPSREAGYFAHTVTDNQGRFLFTNLCPGRFAVGVCFDPPGGVMDDGSQEERTFTAGQEEPALIRVKPMKKETVQ